MADFESRGMPGRNWVKEVHDNSTKRLQGTCLFQQAIYNIYIEKRQTHYDVGAILWVQGSVRLLIFFDSHYCARGHFNPGYQTNRKEVMTGRAVSHRDCLNPFETVE
jgi:hypothetical protein